MASHDRENMCTPRVRPHTPHIRCHHTHTSVSCRLRLETPPKASGCSTQQATAELICSSATPPTTCRGCWVATPPGWAPHTPPCCRPSSVRVSLCVCVCVFTYSVCVFVCVSTAAVLITALSLHQASADGTGGRLPEHHHSSVSLLPPILPSLPAICVSLSRRPSASFPSTSGLFSPSIYHQFSIISLLSSSNPLRYLLHLADQDIVNRNIP